MKTKKASKTNTRSKFIFFAIALTYNLLLGIYLKDFLVLSPMLLTFYLLSALPTLFFVLKIRSTPMRAIVLVVLFLVMAMSIVSSLSCRRLLPMLTFVVTAIEMMHLGTLTHPLFDWSCLLRETYISFFCCVINITLHHSFFIIHQTRVRNCRGNSKIPNASAFGIFSVPLFPRSRARRAPGYGDADVI